jgi:hypothetical protein
MLDVTVTLKNKSYGISNVDAVVRVRRRVLKKGVKRSAVAAAAVPAAVNDSGDILFRFKSSLCSRRSLIRNYILWNFAAAPPSGAASNKSRIAAFMDNMLAPSNLTVHCTSKPCGVNGRYAALHELKNMANCKDYYPMFRAAVRGLHQVLFQTLARVLLRGMRALRLRRELWRRARARVAVEHLQHRSGSSGGAALVRILAAWLR